MHNNLSALLHAPATLCLTSFSGCHAGQAESARELVTLGATLIYDGGELVDKYPAPSLLRWVTSEASSHQSPARLSPSCPQG